MFKVCVIGCGGIAQVHGAVLAALEGVTLSGCCDIVPEKAKAYAEKFHCTPYTDYETLLKAEKPDAVHLCTPHYLHTPMAVKAAEMGVQVFTEKPPVISWQEWETLQKAAEKVRIGVCVQNRYNPPVEKALSMIASGEMGEVKGVRGIVNWDRGADYYVSGDWRGKWATEGGGALINQAVHTLDLMLLFLGKPDQVSCHMANRRLQGVIEVEDTVEAYLESAGRRGIFYVSNAFSGNAPVLVEVVTEKGCLRMEEDTLEIKKDGSVSKQRFEMPTPVGKSYWGSGHYACIADYYRCMAEGKPFKNDLKNVATTIETMLTMYDQGRKEL